jgi:hypothetical protein
LAATAELAGEALAAPRKRILAWREDGLECS